MFVPIHGRQGRSIPTVRDHNRMTVEIEFLRTDGGLRRARAWVDTGNEALVLAEPLARELGLDISGLSGGGSHSVASASPAPQMRLAGLPLEVRGVATRVRAGAHLAAGVTVEAQLPASALRSFHVVLDYPAQRFTVARPGALDPRGIAIPCRINPATGLLMVAATVDGENAWLGVDNGSAGTWVSSTLTSAWRARHPQWPCATGAAGSANFFGFPFEAKGVLMRLPELVLGTLREREVTVLGLDQGFFDWYSRKSAGAVVGFIGANALKHYRVEINFPGQMTWWEAGPPAAERDLDIVPLTLRPEAGGGVTVAGVVTRDDRPLVVSVQAGDRILRVDALDVTTAAMGTVVDSLRGNPGETRVLVLERAGTRHTVEARVVRLP